MPSFYHALHCPAVHGEAMPENQGHHRRGTMFEARTRSTTLEVKAPSRHQTVSFAEYTRHGTVMPNVLRFAMKQANLSPNHGEHVSLKPSVLLPTHPSPAHHVWSHCDPYRPCVPLRTVFLLCTLIIQCSYVTPKSVCGVQTQDNGH